MNPERQIYTTAPRNWRSVWSGCIWRCQKAARARSSGGLQELDETAYWLELLEETNILPADRLKPLRDGADALIAIFVAIVKKVKRR